MSQSKNIPKPPKLPTTKQLETSQKPLPQTDGVQKSPEEKPSQGQIAESSPEIKPTTAELDLDREQNLGMSDLKKP
jgi:hypothetical protein